MADKVSKSLHDVLSLLKTAPAPPSSFLVRRKSILSINGQRLKWSQKWKSRNEDGGKCWLERRKWWRLRRDSVVMIARINCVIHELSPGELLVQSETKGEPLDLTLVMVDTLTPIVNVQEASLEMDEAKRSYAIQGGKTYSMRLPRDLPEGKHRWLFEAPFSSMSTVIVLTSSTRAIPGARRPGITIFELCPQQQMINVLPLDWFNNGGYDYDYQWIKCIIRSQADGRLYGAGVRMGVFSLSDDGKQVTEWLLHDPHYFPRLS